MSQARLLANRLRWSLSLFRPRRLASTTAVKDEGPEPPNGFLFNEKPLLPGEKRQKEDWENIFVYGMGFNLLLMLVIAIYKPKTTKVSYWARLRAEKRLAEMEGEPEVLADS